MGKKESVPNRRYTRAFPKRQHDAECSAYDPPADVAAALATISDRDLCGLSAAIGGSPNIAPGLLAWLETAVDWEVNRRAGIFYALLGPRAVSVR